MDKSNTWKLFSKFSTFKLWRTSWVNELRSVTVRIQWASSRGGRGPASTRVLPAQLAPHSATQRTRSFTLKYACSSAGSLCSDAQRDVSFQRWEFIKGAADLVNDWKKARGLFTCCVSHGGLFWFEIKKLVREMKTYQDWEASPSLGTLKGWVVERKRYVHGLQQPLEVGFGSLIPSTEAPKSRRSVSNEISPPWISYGSWKYADRAHWGQRR